MKNRLVPAFIVFAAAFLVYFNTLQNGFVWDDHIVLENNPFLEEPSNFKKIISPAFFTKVESIEGGARPVFLLSLLADRAFWGKNPGGYHLTNVILHALNSILVYWLTLYIFSSGGALIAGLIFAVHPIHTEAVNAVTFRADLLASLFVFLSLLCHIRFQRITRSFFKVSLIFISGGFYALGLLSKEMAITLPALALGFDILFPPLPPRGCDSPQRGGTCKAGGGGRRVWVWRLAALGLYTAIALWYMGFRAHRSGYHAIAPNTSRQVNETDLRDALRAVRHPEISGSGSQSRIQKVIRNGQSMPSIVLGSNRARAVTGPVRMHRTFTPSRPSWDLIYEDNRINFLTMSGVLAEYFSLMAIPHPLQADRAPRLIKSLSSGRIWASWLALLFLAWLAVRCRKKYPVITLGLAWCFITFLPVSNIIHIYNPIAERYLYLISAGACWIFAFLICKAAGKIPARHLKVVQVALAGVILLPYSLLTITRNRDWRSDETLFSDDLENYEDLSTRGGPASGWKQRPLKSARTHYNLGYLRQMEGRIQEAILEYKRALTINPQYIEAMTNLGAIFESRGNIEEGMKLYQESVALNPQSPIPHDRLGFLFEKKGRLTEAIEAYRQALRTDDGFIPARLHLAASLVRTGRVNQAIEELNEVTRIDPSCADAYYNLGMIYDGLGNFPQAAAQLKRVVGLDPYHTDATMNLGVVYHHMGDLFSAIRWLKRAGALNPEAPGVYYNLAIVYSDQSRLESALKTFKKAIKIKPDYGDAWYNLAVTYQKLGRLQDALKAYEETLKMQPQRLEVLVNLGGLCELTGDLKQAKRYLLKAVEAAPDRVAPHNNLGNIYLKEGRIQKAIEEYRQALKYIEVSGNAAPTLYNLGTCYYKQGKITQASNEWRAAIKVNPEYLPAYYMLAEAYKKSGRAEDAKNLWRKVLEIEPGNPKALKELEQ